MPKIRWPIRSASVCRIFPGARLLEGAKTLPMTQDAKDAQIGRVTRELLQPRTDAGHVDQRLETMSGHLRHAFCEPQRLEVREGRLRTLLSGGAA